MTVKVKPKDFLSSLELSEKVYNALIVGGHIYTISDLLQYSASNLKDISRIGIVAIKEIEDKLKIHGLSLKIK